LLSASPTAELIAFAKELKATSAHASRSFTDHSTRNDHNQLHQVSVRRSPHKLGQNNRHKHDNRHVRFDAPTATASSSKSSKKCGKCGYDYPHKGKCPAEGHTCANCNKLNHFKSVCRSRPATSRQVHSVQQLVSTAAASTSKNQGKSISVPPCLDQASQKPTESPSTEIYSCFATNTIISHSSCPRIIAYILGTELEMRIDTQASINAISVEQFGKMDVKPILRPYDVPTLSFNGKSPFSRAAS